MDLGTGSTRPSSSTRQGDLIARGQAEYPLYKPHPGWSSRTRRSGGKRCARLRVRRSPILIQRRSPASACRGRSTARYLPTAPDSPCSGCRSARPPLASRVRLGRAARGGLAAGADANAVGAGNTLAKVLWVKDHATDVYQQSRWMLLPKDWLRYRLTGQIAAEVSDASTTAAFDLHERSGAGKF